LACALIPYGARRRRQLSVEHNIELILTLTGGLVAALAFGLITNRLGLSPIVGYLIAGIAVGPYTPGFIVNKEIADQLAEVGVILLMFGVGLQFHFKELLAVKNVAVPGAIVQSLTATVLGAVAMHFFGWSWTAGIVFGLAISVASTVVLIRVLVDNNDLHTPTGHIAVGWLVMEDLFTVFALVMLPAMFGKNAAEFSLVTAVGMPTLKIAALVAFIFIVGGWAVPRLLTYIAKTRSRELFTLAVLMVALGTAVGSAKFFGVSMALGAFLGGMVVARSEFSLRAATEALPMRDAFAVLFFVSVGMLVDFKNLLASPVAVLVAIAIIFIGKPLSALVLVVVMRYPLKVALSVAVALAQIGEFSFILATVGRQLEILPDTATNALVAAAIVSITLNPVLYRAIDPVHRWLERQAWIPRSLKAGSNAAVLSANDKNRPDLSRAIVIGYGPVGQTVSRLLRENEIDLTVIELNHDSFRRLKSAGVHVVYGDASHTDTLKGAGIETANFLILSSSTIQGAEDVIKTARELNPRVKILARTAYLRELPTLLKAGAHEVFTGEGEVALSMTEHILRDFGATPEQIDRESERIRNELFGKSAQR
jgi:monovalent cation:H+ antiporter-2, CPA2 family